MRRWLAAAAVAIAAVAAAWGVVASGNGPAPAPGPAPAAAAAAAAVSVFPSPGTISASPSTSISFRGVPPERLGTLVVDGSRSGRHTGRWRPHSDGRGASWRSGERFLRGERVTVRSALTVTGARAGDFAFRIARIPDRVTIPKTVLEDIEPGRLRSFQSRRDLQPPHVTVDPNRGPTEPGYVFLSPKSKKDLKQAGPMIVDNAGRLVWFRPLPGIRAATDFRTQTYLGRPVLTYWDGTSRQGIGVGDLVILDQSYREIRRFRAPNGLRPDLHEFRITPRGTALLISYPTVRTDLRPVGGARDGLAVDSVIQEIDIATGLTIFEWHSLGNIALRETYSRPAASPKIPFDYVHANSVGLDRDGNLLVSARNTWAVYKIDRTTGRLIWRLGGKRSDFRLGRGVRFAWQHDARRRADGALTLFDNSAFPPVRKHSRALALQLDEQRRTARLLAARKHPRKLLAATQGNVQNLPGGGAFVNWGSQRWFNEFDRNGRVVWNARVALGFESYRGYRLPWIGRPLTPPRAAAVRRGRSALDVYASWNGATEVRTWELLGGPSSSSLRPLASAPRSGFETRIHATRAPTHVAMRARDAAGNILASSPVVKP